jgi:hypothetical protein
MICRSLLSRGCFFLTLALVLCVPSLSAAQSLKLFPGTIAIDVGSVRIVPRVGIGYQHMAWNFNFPLAPQGFNWWFQRGALDLSLKNVNLWVGDARIDVLWSENLSIFCEGQANAQKSVGIQESEAPSDLFVGAAGRYERGSKLAWWQLDGGASFRIYGDVSVLGGVKIDHLSLRITGPSVLASLGIAPESVERHGGDLLNKLWVPYAGLQINASNYRAAFVYSPFATVNMKLPLNEVDDFDFFTSEEARFSLKKTGQYFGADFEYSASLPLAATASVWAKVHYLRIRGNASEETRSSGFADDRPITDEAIATLTRYSISGGLSVGMAF